MTIAGEEAFRSSSTDNACHGSTSPLVKMTFFKSGNRPPYIMLVLLTRVSNSFSSLLESEFQELHNASAKQFFNERKRYFRRDDNRSTFSESYSREIIVTSECK